MTRLHPERTVARIACYLILALGVYFAQQGALIHAVSHLHEFTRIGAPGAATLVSSPATTDTDEFCLECLAFAQVASAVAGHLLFAPNSDSPATTIALSGGLVEHTVTVVFRARAPPSLV